MPEHSIGSARLQGTVKIRVKSDISLENLHRIIDEVTGMTGCRPCGLLGIDLYLGGDPPEFGQVGKLPGVNSASLGR
jgi:hypothetical protein